MARKKITKKDMKKNIEEMENALEINDIETAAKAARFLLPNVGLLSDKESMKVSGLVQTMLEKNKRKRSEVKENDKTGKNRSGKD